MIHFLCAEKAALDLHTLFKIFLGYDMTPEQLLLDAFLKDSPKRPWRQLIDSGISPENLASVVRIVAKAGTMGWRDGESIAYALKKKGNAEGYFAPVIAESDEKAAKWFYKEALSWSWFDCVRWFCDARPDIVREMTVGEYHSDWLMRAGSSITDAADCLRLLMERGFSSDDEAAKLIKDAERGNDLKLAETMEAVRQSFHVSAATGPAKAPSRKKRLG